MSASSDGSWHARRWDLPPLILHPFGGPEGALEEPLPRGRYAEFRMLCLVGKDVMRWIAQCVDFAGRNEPLAQAGIRPQSFADLLVHGTPAPVSARFESWDVHDYRRILSRAIGLTAVFPDPPDLGVVSEGFLEDYYSYADKLFACYQGLEPFVRLEPEAFPFSLYTSDEYLSTLECAAGEPPHLEEGG